jgi:hypothetical protein
MALRFMIDHSLLREEQTMCEHTFGGFQPDHIHPAAQLMSLRVRPIPFNSMNAGAERAGKQPIDLPAENVIDAQCYNHWLRKVNLE